MAMRFRIIRVATFLSIAEDVFGPLAIDAILEFRITDAIEEAIRNLRQLLDRDQRVNTIIEKLLKSGAIELVKDAFVGTQEYTVGKVTFVL